MVRRRRSALTCPVGRGDCEAVASGRRGIRESHRPARRHAPAVARSAGGVAVAASEGRAEALHAIPAEAQERRDRYLGWSNEVEGDAAGDGGGGEAARGGRSGVELAELVRPGERLASVELDGTGDVDLL